MSDAMSHPDVDTLTARLLADRELLARPLPHPSEAESWEIIGRFSGMANPSALAHPQYTSRERYQRLISAIEATAPGALLASPFWHGVLTRIRVHLFTHDGYFLGEDGDWSGEVGREREADRLYREHEQRAGRLPPDASPSAG